MLVILDSVYLLHSDCDCTYCLCSYKVLVTLHSVCVKTVLSLDSFGGSQVAGGGSQQAGSKQQVEAPAMMAPVAAPAPAPAPAMMAPKPTNRWTHSHPAQPRCTNSVTHTHKYNNARHVHTYSCSRPAPRAAQPTVDVEALQAKLKAKGYYKGPIDGVVGPATRSALQRFMQR